MRDYLNIGSTPPDEDCTQVGAENADALMQAECRRYIEALRAKLGPEPFGAILRVKSFAHDFGTYYEVVCYYDDRFEDALEYAFKCESDGPQTWNG